MLFLTTLLCWHTLNLIECKNLFNESKQTVIMYVYDIYGRSRDLPLTVQLIDLSLEKMEDNIISTMSDTYTVRCKLDGATSGITQK